MYVEHLEQCQVNDSAFHRLFDLWWSDFQEAGIDSLYVAFSDEDEVIGFQTVNEDGLCIAIEVIKSAQGQGVGRELVKESGCWKPDDNQAPEFWEKMSEEFGW